MFGWKKKALDEMRRREYAEERLASRQQFVEQLQLDLDQTREAHRGSHQELQEVKAELEEARRDAREVEATLKERVNDLLTTMTRLQRDLDAANKDARAASTAAALLFGQLSGGGVFKDRLSYREIEAAVEAFRGHTVVIDQYAARQVADVYIGPRVANPFEPTGGG